MLRHSYGYPLPHRGDTRNGGDDHGYSRLTDGDLKTYWKSHPYLSHEFTGESDASLPQWVVVDLGVLEQVSGIRIDWGEPYAKVYEVAYFTGEDAMDKPAEGAWNRLPGGAIRDGRGGSVTLTLSPKPLRVRFLRILMSESSGTCDSHGAADRRNCVGYAINELSVGTFTEDGAFMDLVHHSPDQNQTPTHASSIDPWHAESDLNLDGDQTGLDLFYTSGITSRLPAMIPVTMLYGTPEDSAAQIAYLVKRGYRISHVEMGEEPDGQYMMPEDYAALYLQWATAIHRVDPKLKLGGPSFQGVNEDIRVWPDAKGRTSWLGRFLDYLKARGRMSDFAFLSFEHYPFPPCNITWSDLYREPQLVSHILQVWRDDGLPPDVPMLITESNMANALTHPMVDIFAALWLADNVGAFFAAGGTGFYHSPVQPEPLRHGCHGWGTYGNFVADEDLNVKAHTSQYFASRLINLEWVKKGDGVHDLFPAAVDVKDAAGHALVGSYAVHRPDGEWSLLLVNRDQTNPHDVRIVFEDGKRARSFAGAVAMVSFGSEQYVWKSDGPRGHPDPGGPPVSTTLRGGAASAVTLPKASVTVVRGKIED
jgi:hypothetical protein